MRTAGGGDHGAAKAYRWRGVWGCRQHPRSWAHAPGLPSCSRAIAVSHTQQPLHQACEGPQNPPEHGPPARREELAAQVLSQRTRGPASGETGRLHGTTCLYKIGGGGRGTPGASQTWPHPRAGPAPRHRRLSPPGTLSPAGPRAYTTQGGRLPLCLGLSVTLLRFPGFPDYSERFC